MSNQTVEIEELHCASPKCLQVTPQTFSLYEGDVITFTNELTPSAIATIEIFDITKNTTISGFCEEHSGTQITVPAKQGGTAGTTDCTVAKSDANYQYKVSAPGYLDLDPVIIVEPKVQTFMPGILFEPWFVGILGLIVGALFGYYFRGRSATS